MTVGCLYLPNGNPASGPKFDYKLRWFKRFSRHAKKLLASGKPVVLAGDYNVMPTDLDVYAPERWRDDALFRPEVREAYRKIVDQGWTDALRALHPDERIYTFWDYWRNAYARNAGHFPLSTVISGIRKWFGTGRLRALGALVTAQFEKAAPRNEPTLRSPPPKYGGNRDHLTAWVPLIRQCLQPNPPTASKSFAGRSFQILEHYLTMVQNLPKANYKALRSMEHGP